MLKFNYFIAFELVTVLILIVINKKYLHSRLSNYHVALLCFFSFVVHCYSWVFLQIIF